MKAPIISIGGSDFVCKSLAKATELAKLLGEITPVKHCHSDDYRNSWYEEDREDDYDSLRVSLKVSQEVRKKPSRLALPAPRKGSLRCNCGRGTVMPGERCPSCDETYTTILMNREI